jgi:hypothetical protein
MGRQRSPTPACSNQVNDSLTMVPEIRITNENVESVPGALFNNG